MMNNKAVVMLDTETEKPILILDGKAYLATDLHVDWSLDDDTGAAIRRLHVNYLDGNNGISSFDICNNYMRDFN